MIRKAFKMAVHPGAQAEYERRHNPVWTELEETLAAHGVRTYSIFLDPQTSELFAYAEIESEQRWRDIAGTTVFDGSPKAAGLKEVFRLGCGDVASVRERAQTAE